MSWENFSQQKGSGKLAERGKREEQKFGSSHNETIFRGRIPFWAPDKPLESQNEEIYLWVPQWDLYH